MARIATPQTISAALRLVEQDMLDTIDRFLARHDMSPTQFGKQSLGDPGLYPELVQGRSLSIATAHFLSQWMEQYQRNPAGAKRFAERHRAQRRQRRNVADGCQSCGSKPADAPGMLCAACHAYAEHSA